MPEWQPIETAPRDGRRILLAREGWVEIGRWLPDYAAYEGAPAGAWMDDYDNGGPEDRGWPTHWMPIPEFVGGVGVLPRTLERDDA